MSAWTFYREELRASPVRASLGMFVQYGMFAAGVFLALLLLLTRVPLRAVDRSTGWRIRERFVNALARVSPG